MATDPMADASLATSVAADQVAPLSLEERTCRFKPTPSTCEQRLPERAQIATPVPEVTEAGFVHDE
jgi:hypothetical protein